MKIYWDGLADILSFPKKSRRPTAAGDPSGGWLDDMTASGSGSGTTPNRSTRQAGESSATRLAAPLRQDRDVDGEGGKESLNLLFSARLARQAVQGHYLLSRHIKIPRQDRVYDRYMAQDGNNNFLRTARTVTM
jgi:hypothetical protein